MKLILASGSPRRAEVLRDAGIPFEICVPRVDETQLKDETAEALVARLAEAKAGAAATQWSSLQGQHDGNSTLILGADTCVELDGTLFGKPISAADASRMLAALELGRTHRVLTGVAVLRLPDGAMQTAVECTNVTFAPLERAEIEEYVASGEPFDKAGGYAIQGRAGCYITRIEGCYFNVVGLPLARLFRLLKELGWSLENSEI